MDGSGEKTSVSKSITYGDSESAAVFRMVWYVIASKPGVLLEDYNEAESQIFKGDAQFSAKIDDVGVSVGFSVDADKGSVDLKAHGDDQTKLEGYLDSIAGDLEGAIKKYHGLPDEDRSKLKRALVAKTCWDRLVREILNKSPLSDVYIQLAHGREMMIKATEGEDVIALPLTTAGWLSQIESLPRSEALPANIATELAKKTIDWKRETHDVISRYL
ncbi:MAG: hypothetical protein ACFE7R_03380 [Candidatus Hodarchaeota archaeon]